MAESFDNVFKNVNSQSISQEIQNHQIGMFRCGGDVLTAHIPTQLKTKSEWL